MLVDVKTFELADYFISDLPPEAQRPGMTQELAERIQRAVEDWFDEQGARGR